MSDPIASVRATVGPSRACCCETKSSPHLLHHDLRASPTEGFTLLIVRPEPTYTLAHYVAGTIDLSP